jgi:hypothetical protein
MIRQIVIGKFWYRLVTNIQESVKRFLYDITIMESPPSKKIFVVRFFGLIAALLSFL